MFAGLEAEILQRVIAPDAGGVPAPLAELVLALDFPAADHARMDELTKRSNRGELTESERAELEGYANVGHFLALLQSKARISLGRRAAA